MIVVATIILILAILVFSLVTCNVLLWSQVGCNELEGSVSVLIPARNEEANLPRLLDSLIGQGAITEIVIANDYSTDGTQEAIEAAAAIDPRIRYIVPAILPPDWCGKNWVCATLAKEAQGQWLLFLDADTKLEPSAIKRMLAEVRTRNLTLLSCWPTLEMHSFAERLLMPMLNFVLLTLFPAPLAALRMGDMSLGLGHGACMFFRRAEYLLLEGHSAVRSEILEDCRLAQLWRKMGLRGLCLDGKGVVSVRMYRSLSEIWHGFSKNLFPAFKHQYSFWLFWMLHVCLFFAPFALAFLRGPVGNIFLAAAACIIACRLALALRFKEPLWPALLHPVAQFFVIALGLTSWFSVISGRGVTWKGRRYLQAKEELN